MNKFGFLGLGLIGGSIARAVREKLPDAKIYVYDTNAEALSLSEAEGIADCTADHIDDTFRECDMIFLCAPVKNNAENLRSLSSLPLSDNCIITDVGSVKTDIHNTVRSLNMEERFIGGHPMTGSERIGFANSRANLLQDAYYCITPTGKAPQKMLDDYTELVRTLGAIPVVLDYKEHDYVVAAISHVPHVIASSLVNLIKKSDNKEELMKMLAAGGFKDITRIASSSSKMWQQICLTNSENISKLLSDYIASLSDIKADIDSARADEIFDFFAAAREYRDSFAIASSGPIKTQYIITVDIRDETGSIATIAALLAKNNINIKNIGINHNREAAEGILKIELYDESSVKNALSLLKESGYAVRSRSE
ncbi:MAG: prephenate dehydrogenase/arogenate dehydrogenase family protein [Lachnospiraceae bacterium]|nr:prephenate dehydrogenase/arogenate dehydrogenase family protein [Lachnospiraceae bacterium]